MKKLFSLLNTFYFYAILGFLIESIVYLLFQNDYGSGILYGPWTPIYGFGILVLLGIQTLIHKWTPNHPNLFIFLLSASLLSLLELIGGLYLEYVYDIIFWSYYFFPLAIGDYISVEMFFIWGFLSLLILHIIHPFFQKIIKKIPISITITITFCFIADLILTFTTKNQLSFTQFLWKMGILC